MPRIRLFVHIYGTKTIVTGSEGARICNAVPISEPVKAEWKWQEIKHWLGGLHTTTAAQTQTYYTTWKNSKTFNSNFLKSRNRNFFIIPQRQSKSWEILQEFCKKSPHSRVRYKMEV